MGGGPIIAVTGTPGTGKSTFSKALSEDLDLALISLNEFIEDKGIYETGPDGTRLVDPSDLRNAFDEFVEEQKGGFVVDGHLSHLLNPDSVTDIVVLRTDPEILEERLENRDYSKEKIQENLEAEILDIILKEAVRKHGEEKIFEIDNTNIEVSETVSKIKEVLDGKRDLSPGSVDWLEEHVGKIQD